MFDFAGAALTALRLRLLRRRQYDGLKIRRVFRERYGVEVGLYSFGCFDPWRMPGPLRIGRYCSIAQTARVVPMNHPFEALTTHPVVYDPAFGAAPAGVPPVRTLEIQDDVWIGHNATILPRCKFIGRGAVIGAGAIVTRDVDPYAVVMGNPARPVRPRFSEDVALAVEASRWWEMDMKDLAELARRRPDLIHRPDARSLRQWTEGQTA